MESSAASNRLTTVWISAGRRVFSQAVGELEFALGPWDDAGSQSDVRRLGSSEPEQRPPLPSLQCVNTWTPRFSRSDKWARPLGDSAENNTLVVTGVLRHPYSPRTYESLWNLGMDGIASWGDASP